MKTIPNLRSFWMVLISGVVIYAAIIFFSDPTSLTQVLGQFPKTIVLWVLLLSLVNYLLRFLRWQCYCAAIDASVPLRESAAIFATGLTMCISPGKVGEFLKAYLLERSANVPFGRGAAIVLAERITDVTAIVLLTLMGTIALTRGRPILLGTILLLSLSVITLCSKTLRHSVLRWVARYRRLTRLTSAVDLVGTELSKLMSASWFLLGVLVALGAWAAEGLGLHLILLGMGIKMDLPQVLSIYALSTFIGAASTLPGGIGPTEASLTTLLLLREVPLSTAGPATVLIRVCTLWFAVAIGLLVISLAGGQRLAVEPRLREHGQ
jgi:uncharacterized protein (TIRG00374 family)